MIRGPLIAAAILCAWMSGASVPEVPGPASRRRTVGAAVLLLAAVLFGVAGCLAGGPR